MTEIKCGNELDLAVAKAIGLTWQDATRTVMAAWWHKDGWCYRKLPLFSTDLSAAFVAAEETGLFRNWLLTDSGSGWYFQDHSERSMEDRQSKDIIASTPALVICAAILKLFEEKEASSV